MWCVMVERWSRKEDCCRFWRCASSCDGPPCSLSFRGLPLVSNVFLLLLSLISSSLRHRTLSLFGSVLRRKGTLRELEQHRFSCEFLVVSCDACGFQCKKCELERHRQMCPGSQMSTENCPFAEFGCAHSPLVCPPLASSTSSSGVGDLINRPEFRTMTKHLFLLLQAHRKLEVWFIWLGALAVFSSPFISKCCRSSFSVSLFDIVIHVILFCLFCFCLFASLFLGIPFSFPLGALCDLRKLLVCAETTICWIPAFCQL